MLQEVGTGEAATSFGTLRRAHRISAATFSHHTRELETAGLVQIVREGKFASLILRRDVVRGYLDRLSRSIDKSIDLKEVTQMSSITSSEAAKAVVRRNTEEVQGKGNFDVFEELFADNFIDHTPQPGTTPNKAGVRKLYTYMRTAFPDFHAEIHWQLADGDRVTTYKTYHGIAERKRRITQAISYCLVPGHASCCTAGSNRSTRSLVGAGSLRISHPVNTTIRLLSGKTISRWPPNPLAIQAYLPFTGYNHHLNPYLKFSSAST